jgi:hypothetical protein
MALLPAVAGASEDPGSLDRLHDLVVPPSAAWWPLAPGWVGLAFGLFILFTWLLWRGHLTRQRNRYRSEALIELAALRSESAPVSDASAQLMILLKRTALSAFPREELASLNGEAWWRYLDDRSREPRFAEGLGPALEDLAYRGRDVSEGTPPPQMEHFYQATEDWIRNHRGIPSTDLAAERPEARDPARIAGDA